VVEALSEEEVDLEVCRCCRWVKWIKTHLGLAICDLGLEKFTGGFLQFRVGKFFEVCCSCGWVCDLGNSEIVIFHYVKIGDFEFLINYNVIL
jgi:hypothetical protein